MSSTVDLFADIESQLAGLFDGERDLIANAANCSALLFERLPDVNWVGFYFLRNGELVVGPFQGKPACIRIPLGRGVCGIAARDRASLRVDDVNEFADHIACDTASRSEIVLPLVKDGRLLGVLDIDSPSRARFDPADQTALERVAALFVSAVDA